MEHDKILKGILDGKEERVKIQKNILKKHKNTLISFTLNIPGLNKKSEKFKKAFAFGTSKIEKSLNLHKVKIVYATTCENMAGYMFFCSVQADAVFIKRLMMDIESESKIGRLFDIDVFNEKEELLSRRDFSIMKRKCLICDRDAVVCSRSRAHHILSILCVIDKIIDESLEEEICYELHT
ncbi:MAG: citrate lyase holo-[acyl-carrier protein] synthase [Sarcina sp.]